MRGGGRNAERGSIRCNAPSAPGPEMRTTATPERPGVVLRAKMVRLASAAAAAASASAVVAAGGAELAAAGGSVLQ